METNGEVETLTPEETLSEPDFSTYSKEWRRLGTGTYWSERDQARFEYAISKVKEGILKALNEGPVFARWSPDIELDRKPDKTSQAIVGNWYGQKEPLKEAGISVSTLDEKQQNFGLDLRYSMAGNRGYEPRTLYILRGKPVDRGLDSELVLDPTSIEPLFEVPYESQVVAENPDITQRNLYGPEAIEEAQRQK